MKDYQNIESIFDLFVAIKCFCITESGRFGWISEVGRAPDHFVLFDGADVPFIVWELDESDIKHLGHMNSYQILGECYIYGVMEGEVMEYNEAQFYTALLAKTCVRSEVRSRQLG